MPFTVKSQTTEKIEFFSQGIGDSHNLMFETLVNADHEYLKISRSTLLDIKLWMKDDDLLTDHFWNSFRFIHSPEGVEFIQNVFF